MIEVLAIFTTLPPSFADLLSFFWKVRLVLRLATMATLLFVVLQLVVCGPSANAPD